MSVMPSRNLLLTRRILQVFAKAIAAIAALALLICVSSYAMNIFDEALTPEAKALLSLPPNPYGPNDNIYVSLAGFDAESQQSIVVVGQTRISRYNAELDSMIANPAAEIAGLTRADPKRLAFKGSLDYCHPSTSSLWSDVRAHRAEVAAVLADNQELYQRYDSLLRLRGYYDTSRPSFLEPDYYIPQPARCLFLANAAIRLQATNQQLQAAALSDLSQDLLMWRAVLKGDGRLLSKMIAAGALHADFLLLADMIADPRMDLKLFDGPGQLAITPFELQDWSISNGFAAQMRADDVLFAQLAMMASARTGYDGTPVRWWQSMLARLQGHFFKINATENLQAKHFTQLIQLADSDPAEFSIKREQYRHWLRNNVTMFSPAGLFNPVGKILVQLAVPAYESYLARVYDVAALQRLVYLIYQIRREAIDSPAVPAFLRAHPEWSTHPVDGRPFTWNAATGELVVIPAGNNPQSRRFSVSVWAEPILDTA